MKKLNHFLSLLLIFTSQTGFAFGLKNNLHSITDEQASELGMTEITELLIGTINSDLKFAEEGYTDLYDDQVNARRSKIVLIINEGDRDRIVNPKGQTAALYIDGILQKEYDVSTGSGQTVTTTSGRKYVAKTPYGFYKPKSAYNEYYSRTFFGSDMQYAVFFNRGIATHTTTAVNKLGERASGGCVRMKRSEAKEVNEAIIDTGENHRVTRNIRICHPRNGSPCLNRRLYINREKGLDISRTTGEELLNRAEIWTYDATIIVKPGAR